MTDDELYAFGQRLGAHTKALVIDTLATAMTTLQSDVNARFASWDGELRRVKALAPAPGEPGPQGPPGPAGRDGQSVELATVDALVTKALAHVPTLVRDEVARVFAGVPLPKDGKDGKDVDLLAVKAFADAAATTATAGLLSLVRDEVARAVTALAPPVALVKATVLEELKTWPRPKDGEPGPPGRDGTLEEVTAEHDGERTVTLVRKDGSRLVTITLPIPIDRGVWKPGTWYGKGDGVTWGGSFWIAQEATNAKPGESGADSRAWRLAVKRGTDGKAGRDGKDAE
jgi:hypothetical protein